MSGNRRVRDSIDGARGFARKNGEFSVMIALLDQGQPPDSTFSLWFRRREQVHRKRCQPVFAGVVATGDVAQRRLGVSPG